MKYTETEYIKLWKKIKIKHAIELVAFELEYNIKTRTKTNLDIIKKPRTFKREIDSKKLVKCNSLYIRMYFLKYFDLIHHKSVKKNKSAENKK